MTKQDWQAVEPAIADVAAREITPTSMLGDTYYGSEENLHIAAQHRVDLIAAATPPERTERAIQDRY
jgi:hypothetical protein